MADHVSMRLGRLPPDPRAQARLLRVDSYVKTLPPSPPAIDWQAAVRNPGMMLNDSLGCCTIAGLGHELQVVTANRGRQVDVTDADVLKAYVEACDYDPNDPSSDRGGVMTEVLNYARKTGIGAHRIGAYAAVSSQDEAKVRSAIHLFGGLYVGVALPLSGQTQDIWRVALGSGSAARAGSWGGHAIFIGGYDEHGLWCITWGGKKRMSWDWFFAYCEEAYAILSTDWVDGTGPAPSGLDVSALAQDLKEVTS